ncbi:MAG: glycosyltransferase family 2 protein [Chloroflexota bacterium]|nr:glycosyltransferase family 2 protein [Chloroflexota bacterium]
MRVTIITPSYNQAAFLPATIASVLNQDYADIEYLIFDGASTDGSVEILRAQTDPRLKWVSQKDGGQTDALNNGLRTATGEIITFINSDDTLLPGAVHFAVEYFAAHPACDLLYGDAEIIDADGKRMQVIPSTPYNLEEVVLGQQTFLQQGTFWRRRVSETIGGFDDAIQYTFDIDYWARTALAGFQLDYVPGLRAQFRMHDASKSVSQKERFYADWRLTFAHIFAHPNTPQQVRQRESESWSYLDWHYAKLYWKDRDYDKARSMLRPFLAHRSRTRRFFSRLMLAETYTGTRLSTLVARLYARVAGYSIGGFDY